MTDGHDPNDDLVMINSVDDAVGSDSETAMARFADEFGRGETVGIRFKFGQFAQDPQGHVLRHASEVKAC